MLLLPPTWNIGEVEYWNVDVNWEFPHLNITLQCHGVFPKQSLFPCPQNLLFSGPDLSYLYLFLRILFREFYSVKSSSRSSRARAGQHSIIPTFPPRRRPYPKGWKRSRGLVEGDVLSETVLFLIELDLLYIFSINTLPPYDRSERSVMDARAEIALLKICIRLSLLK